MTVGATHFPADCCVVESAASRRETRYEYGTRFGWDDDRSSGIDVTFTRKGIEVSGFYDSMVGLQGGFISWDDVDAIRSKLVERIPRLHPGTYVRRIPDGKVSGAAPKP